MAAMITELTTIHYIENKDQMRTVLYLCFVWWQRKGN